MGACKSTQNCCCIAIDHDESLILNKPTGKEIRYGPGWFFFPSWWDAEVKKTMPLQNNQYILVQHMVSDKRTTMIDPDNMPMKKRVTTDENEQFLESPGAALVEIIRGPQIYRIRNPYDRISEIKPMLDLSSTQFIVVTDKLTGAKKVETGPQLFCPQPFDELGKVQSMYNLSSTQFIIVIDESTGERQTVTGKILGDQCSTRSSSGCRKRSYMVRSDLTITNEFFSLGPTLFAPKAYDKLSPVYDYIVLNHTQYCRIIDSRTGVMRIEKGPKTFALGPYETLLTTENQNIFDIINIDTENAVLVKNLDTGIDELITTPQKFIPSFTQKFIEIRKLIKLAPCECSASILSLSQWSFLFLI